MIQITGLSMHLSHNGRPLLEDFSFVLNEGDKAAIIGEEGNGKSSLMKLIYDPSLVEGYLEYTGRIDTRGARLGYLWQEIPEPEKALSVYEYLSRSGGIECLESGGAPIEALQLGLSQEDLYSDRQVSTLSGGEKVRLQLVRILLSRPDILLLDEPTNDIDIETLQWMEQFINSCRMPVLYISHDETLIENTANLIIHLELVRKKTVCRHTVARLGYREYIQSRQRVLDHQEQVARKEREEYQDQMERWRKIYEKVERSQENISRADPHGGKMLKRKMKSVKSHEKRFQREKEEMTQLPDVEEAIMAAFPPVFQPAGKRVLELAIPQLRIQERLLAEDISLTVYGGAHIGIYGKNGAGKTTLLKKIAEELARRSDLKTAYMPQNYADLLNLELTPVEYLAPSGKKEEVTKARTFLGSMKYTGEEMAQKASQLSGGQKAKLLFLKMILDGCDVLVLDEPTRNFSPLSNPVIRKALKSFGGAIISVSHDRKYLKEVCDTLYRFTEKGLILTDHSQL